MNEGAELLVDEVDRLPVVMAIADGGPLQNRCGTEPPDNGDSA